MQLPDDVYTNSNVFAFQKLFDGPFQFDVFFESASAKQKLSCEYRLYARKKNINPVPTASTLDSGIPALVESYGKRFEEVFPYPADYPPEKKESLNAFSKAVTSNLVGGVGYFYGTSMVDRKFSFEWDQEEDVNEDDDSPKGTTLTEPKELLTATPSRSFFPRGFYW